MKKTGLPASLIVAALFTGACAMEDIRPAEIEDMPVAAPQTPEVAGAIEDVPVPEPPPPPDPRALLSLQPYEVQGRLGVPGFVRRDGAAQVFQYKNTVCVLDITFYQQDPGGVFIVRHLEARGRDGSIFDADECLISLLPNGVWPEAAVGGGSA